MGDLERLNLNPAFWRDRSVLVTGCTGLLGSRVTDALVRAGARVVGLIRDYVPESRLVGDGLINSISVVRGSVEDLGLLERVLGEYEVSTVVHLAAQTIVRIANRNPISTFESNIRGTYLLLEACRRSPLVSSIVVASSDKAYGEQRILPYTETTSLQGTHPYDVSKSCADLLARAYFETYQLPVAVTRCGNLYGGGDLNFSRAIPGAIASVLKGERPIIRSDGTLTRDYFYVLDGAAATLLLAERIERDGLAGDAFNFSNELRMSVLDVTRRILELMGRADLEPEILNTARNEIPHQCLSAEKARAVLGWRPLVTLDEGRAETIAWDREHFPTAMGQRQP